jgi:hypothetical protein
MRTGVPLLRPGGLLLVAIVTASSLVVAAPQDVPLETLLRRLGDYIETFERSLSAVVSEEHYHQQLSEAPRGAPSQRRLKSDFLLTQIPNAPGGAPGWIAFRDVFEVDGHAVQDRSDRLIQLFVSPPGDAASQVRSIINAGARHNLGEVTRTINVPTMSLEFAKRSSQGRSDFRRGGRSRINGHQVREVRFTERQLPRIIHTVDNAAAQGTFWIDEETGRVHRTELRVTTGTTAARVRVDYALVPNLALWLPVEMEERYATPRRPVITGRAAYQNFRSFTVTVDTIIKK